MNKRKFMMFILLFAIISFYLFLSLPKVKTKRRKMSHSTRKEEYEPNFINSESNIESLKVRVKFQKNTDAVILLSTMRSGSSILGSIFDERHNVTYLYEPLFPFGEQACNEKTKESVVALLRHASTCHFEKFQALYEPTNRNDIWAKCKLHHVCFVGVSQKFSKFMTRDAGICHMEGRIQHCPVPVNPVQINKHCKNSLIVAMKVIYLCKLEWLIPLLADSDVNVKVVHLVRDPRATLNSRTSHTGKMENLATDTKKVCGTLEADLLLAKTFMSLPMLQQKYLRIRYEDFVLNPVGNTIKIYDFIGINMTMNVKDWLDEAFCASKKELAAAAAGGDQTLKRDSKTVLNLWRKEMTFKAIQMIQEKCENVLDILGYEYFESEKDLHDFSTSYFVPHWH